MVSIFAVNNPIFHQLREGKEVATEEVDLVMDKKTGGRRESMSRNFEARWGCLAFFVDANKIIDQSERRK